MGGSSESMYERMIDTSKEATGVETPSTGGKWTPFVAGGVEDNEYAVGGSRAAIMI
jgi:hypothetical protein